VSRLSLRNLGQLWKRPWVLLTLGVLLVAGILGGPHLWAWYHFSAGRSALERYRIKEARAHFDKCLEVWPSSTEARLLAARAARRAGAFAEAERHLDECRRVPQAETSGAVGLEWALLRVAQGDLKEWEAPLQARLQKEPATAPLILEALAEGYRRLARVHDALRLIDHWLRLQPGNSQALFQRGIVHLQVNATRKAADDFQAVLEHDPEHESARRRLVWCQVQLGRAPDALAQVEFLLRRHPADPDMLILAARARYDLGQKQEARRILEEVIAAHPKAGAALRELGRIEAGAGNDAAAERWLRKARKVLPHDYQIAFTLAQCLERLGKSEEAAEYSKRAQQLKDRLERFAEIQRQEMSQRPSDPALRVEMGKLFLSLDQNEAGFHWLRSALEIDPGNAAAHTALAEYYQRQGDTAQAARHRRLAAGPSSPVAPPR
jgi:tetratricopeptide (TPR) repeat protein